MSTEEQLEQMSRTVTTLCQAIDPDSSHGPETKKIAEYATKTRRLALELAHAVLVGNRSYQVNKSREVRQHLGNISILRANGGIVDT